MSRELIQDLRRELEQAGREPVRLVDPDTKEEFVILRGDVYERLRRLFDAEHIDPSFYEFEEKENPH